ncbi:hypothetical protein [Rhizosaccharibacter radicis]
MALIQLVIQLLDQVAGMLPVTSTLRLIQLFEQQQQIGIAG